ncbi:alpha-like surface protein [Streptococcus pyogenes]|uniref:alpha-like surface protein n=2 Tax=Streptococcus pyogenes TaxID=1314 RepID=UPI00109C6716|nr:alpha-like surface protein [Streptococcus pyogenes]VGX04222.1 cell surface protein [Streptococcus pyogenes]
MFRRSKNNSYDTSQTKQRFSIKKFKFGAASVLIGISFLGGFTQGQFNISTDTVFAAEVISGSAVTLNTNMTKNIQNGRAYIDLYDVKNGKIDPLQLITLNSPDLKTQYVIRQGGNYFTQPSELTTVGAASINYTVLETDGSPHMKPDGQVDIVNVSLTIYNSSALRDKIDEVKKKAEDPKWDEESRDKVLISLDDIKTDIDNNPKTQSDIDNKITEVTNLEKILVPRISDADKNDPVGKDQTVNVGEQPDPTKSLEAVPAGSTVAYKEPVDTKTPGEKNAVVVVTYPDGTVDDVNVKVTVTSKKTDNTAPTLTVTPEQQTVKVDEDITFTVTVEDENEVELGLDDLKAKYENDIIGARVKIKYLTKEPNKKVMEVTIMKATLADKGAITFTAKDKAGNQAEPKTVTINVLPLKDSNEPKGKDQTVNVGEQPDPTKSLEAVPAGSTVAYKEPVDTKTPGEKNAIVVVTYPDKSTDEVPVKVTVVDPRTDAEKNDPTGQSQQVNGKGNKLPATGESATPFFNVAALTIISSVGLLSVSKKKED